MPLAQTTKAAPSRRCGRAPRDLAHRLRRHDREHDLGVRDAGQIGAGADRRRQRQARQMAPVLAIARQRGDMGRVMPPQRDALRVRAATLASATPQAPAPSTATLSRAHRPPIR